MGTLTTNIGYPIEEYVRCLMCEIGKISRKNINLYTSRYVVEEYRATPRNVAYQHRYFIKSVFRMYSGLRKHIQGVATYFSNCHFLPSKTIDTPQVLNR